MNSALRILLQTVLLFFIFVGSATAVETLAYYSDYVSFIGQDKNGYLLFALDNRRGVDGGEYQAEHSGVLYDQYQGWVDLVGTGDYKNTSNVLDKIPSSPTFKFSGEPSKGLMVRSRVNDLRLEIKPIAVRIHESRDSVTRNWGTAAAILSWQGRTIPGRVIYKGLEDHNGNRLTHSYSEPWDNFQGFYLAVKGGAATTWQDIYLRSEGFKKSQRTRGFIDAGRGQASLLSPDLKSTDKSWALGFYRWSKAWKMSLQQVQTDGRIFPPFALLELQELSRKNISNWVIGGSAMSVVEGTIEVNGQKISVLGFAKLIK